MTSGAPQKNWKRVKFGDVVRNLNVNTRNPSADGIERVVGLDHMDPNSLPLRRWDEIEQLLDGTTFTRMFNPGHVLFGKRRAYQRKVSVPSFGGVCSSDILVFEASKVHMLQTYLPYVVQSDGFFDHALDTSAGSLSPRTKWQDLAKYEFDLPPLEEQQLIVNLMSAVDEHIESLMNQIEVSRATRNSVLHELMSNPRPDWTETTLGDIADWFSGGTPRGNRQELYENGTIPWAVIADLSDSIIGSTATCITETALSQIGGRLAPSNSTLISMYATVGRAAMNSVPMATNQAITWGVPNPEVVHNEYLYLLAELNENNLSSSARGATQRNVNREMIRQVSVLLPPLPTQAEIVSVADNLTANGRLCRSFLTSTRALRKALLNSEIG